MIILILELMGGESMAFMEVRRLVYGRQEGSSLALWELAGVAWELSLHCYTGIASLLFSSIHAPHYMSLKHC